MTRKIKISIGVMAHNEEGNIKRLLESIQSQVVRQIVISEILVISSGSTDKTDSIVKKISKYDPLIKLICQKTRLGKASAVNLFLAKAKENIIVLCSADILFDKNSLEKIILPLKNQSVGIVGSHPVPLDNPDTFFGFASHLLWNLHHEISLKSPKMGECIAFRKIFKQIPGVSSVDEANIESLIKGQGYKAVYVSDAIIYNKGVENLKDFIARRRHIYAGHLATRHEYGYSVSTISTTKILIALLKRSRFSWRFIVYTPIVITLEIYSRLLGFIDYKINRQHTVWQITKSTKILPKIGKLNA